MNFPSVSFEEYKKIGPFLQLGENLGGFLSQICEGRLNEVGIRYYGETVDINTHLIASSILVGILKPILGDGVNLINARKHLDERGILLIESQSTRVRSYSNLISLRLKTDVREEWIEGTILSKGKSRLVSVDGIDIEAPLHGAILFIRNNDTPGVIGQIGTLLGHQPGQYRQFRARSRRQRSRRGRGECGQPDSRVAVAGDPFLPEHPFCARGAPVSPNHVSSDCALQSHSWNSIPRSGSFCVKCDAGRLPAGKREASARQGTRATKR